MIARYSKPSRRGIVHKGTMPQKISVCTVDALRSPWSSHPFAKAVQLEEFCEQKMKTAKWLAI